MKNRSRKSSKDIEGAFRNLSPAIESAVVNRSQILATLCSRKTGFNESGGVREHKEIRYANLTRVVFKMEFLVFCAEIFWRINGVRFVG